MHTRSLLPKAVAGPKPGVREEMILAHLAQVRFMAKRARRGLTPNIALEDLVSEGVVGLIAAVDRFEPERGLKLKTYAQWKIRGAILDYLEREFRKPAVSLEGRACTAWDR